MFRISIRSYALFVSSFRAAPPPNLWTEPVFRKMLDFGFADEQACAEPHAFNHPDVDSSVDGPVAAAQPLCRLEQTSQLILRIQSCVPTFPVPFFLGLRVHLRS
jgi:hypothetical protein